MLFFSVETAVAILKPESPLFQAVLEVRVKVPVCELSVKPLAALRKAMLFVMMWLAGPMLRALAGVWWGLPSSGAETKNG